MNAPVHLLLVLVLVLVSTQLWECAYKGRFLTKLIVDVRVLLVVLVLVVVSSQISKCAYRGGYLTKLFMGVSDQLTESGNCRADDAANFPKRLSLVATLTGTGSLTGRSIFFQ